MTEDGNGVAPETPETPEGPHEEGARAAQTTHLLTRAQEGWRERFLAQLAQVPNVTLACEVAGVSRRHVYRVKGEDADFRADWDEAIETACDLLEAVAFEVGATGVERVRRRYDRDGKMIAEEREVIRDTRILELLLKAHRPQKYVDRLRVGADAPDTSQVDADIIALAEELRALAAGPVPDESEIIEAVVVDSSDGVGENEPNAEG